jgi:PucR family transcriptional regulator, purine catabolism regulatory protein
MIDQITSITVEDIRKQALPLGTRVIAGDGHLGQSVTWATVIYPENKSAIKALQRGELALLSSPEGNGQRQLTDVDVVRMAADMNASGVVLCEAASPAAIAEANAFSIPLLLLPSGSRIRMVEKSIVSLLVDKKGQIERRATQIYKQLTQISSRNEGMAALINEIARLTNKAVVVQDKRMNIIDSAEQPQFIGVWEEIDNFLRSSSNLPTEVQDRMRVSELDNPVLMQSLPVPGVARLICPIITKNVGRGYLSIIGRDTELDDIDTLVTEHGAAACALEMAKAKAISETEKRLRGTFLDRLLLGDVSQQEAMRQGERFDHDMQAVHVAIVMAWQGEKIFSNRRLETLINSIVHGQHEQALVWQRDQVNELVVFHASPPDNPIDTALKLAHACAQEAHRQYPGARIAVGVGQAAKDIPAWRNSYRDAVQALELARRLNTDDPLYIGDLGVYQLILSLNDREKLTDFCDRTLGALVKYDRDQNADLIKTLEAFFQCHGNLSQTAETLFVHRNTLLYRMNRINDIAQIDLDRPEIRLALHLALTVRRLMTIN